MDWGWSKAFHPDDITRVDEYWRAAIVAGLPGEIEARLRRSDGIYRWFLFRGSPLRNESGAIVKWYGTNTDIHDRKEAEEQVRRSEAFLAEAQRLTRVGSFSWRVATNEIRWSEQLYRIFELEPGSRVTFDVIGGRVHPEDLHLLYDMIEKAQSAVSNYEYEHRLLMPNGSVKYLHLTAHSTCDHDGQLEYFGAVQDVTQRQFAEAALAEARSELAKISRISSLGVLAASVRRTIRDGNRASDVISGLRALFKSKTVATEQVDLNEATREVIALMMSELQRYGVVLHLEFADHLPVFTGDRIQIQQVVLNLLRNASEAMSCIEGRARRLLIRTERQADNICFTVQDSGTGLAPGEAERLFESFYTTKKDGMGIGLSVSRSII